MIEDFKKSLYGIFAICFIWLICSAFLHREISHGYGETIKNSPIQNETAEKEFIIGDFKITPLATYSLSGRVLGVEEYSDIQSDISPVDVAVGWGLMSDEMNLNRMKVSQNNRWYYWKAKTDFIKNDDIIKNSSNNHIVSDDEFIINQIKKLREGELIKLDGFLISAIRNKDKFQWVSSLSRTDVDNGSCELFYVKSIKYLKKADIMSAK